MTRDELKPGLVFCTNYTSTLYVVLGTEIDGFHLMVKLLVLPSDGNLPFEISPSTYDMALHLLTALGGVDG